MVGRSCVGGKEERCLMLRGLRCRVRGGDCRQGKARYDAVIAHRVGVLSHIVWLIGIIMFVGARGGGC